MNYITDFTKCSGTNIVISFFILKWNKIKPQFLNFQYFIKEAIKNNFR